MMQQAQIQFGFEADNIPLMIEAIPISGESVVLIITKVEDPEELDTRFSKFSPYKKSKPDALHFDGADNIIDIFQKLYEETKKAISSEDSSEKQKNASEYGSGHAFTPAGEAHLKEHGELILRKALQQLAQI